MFLRQYQRQRKCFLSERELEKALRDTLTRAALLGPVIFDWFVLSMRLKNKFHCLTNMYKLLGVFRKEKCYENNIMRIVAQYFCYFENVQNYLKLEGA